MRPPLTSADITYLRQAMPLFSTVDTEARDWCCTQQVQAYLNFYQINFAQQYPALDHRFGYVDAAGFRIAVHLWQPPQPKGTLVVVHGYYDHVGLYGNAIAYGLERGLAVLAFDLPGHGLSSGEPISIDSFDQYADVLEAVMQCLQQGAGIIQPLYGLGQSTGGAVWLNYLWRYEAVRAANPWFARIALCSPLVLPQGWKLGRYLYLLVKHFIKRMPRGPSRSSHAAAFNDFVDHQDPLQAHYLSVHWVGAMKAWHEQFCRFAPLANSPVVIQGTADLTVEWRYNLPLIQAKLPAAQIYMIEGAGHQLVNEAERYQTELFAHISHYFFNEQ
jgi:alpha-beta hydrolase superfamily lysophospholipase